MRVAWSLALLLIAAPVAASPIAFTFTGTLTSVSTMTTASGEVINIGNAPFTVSGVTTGEIDPRWEGAGKTWPAIGAHPYLAIATWDLGIYGTAVVAMDYVEYGSTTAGVFGIALDGAWTPNQIVFPNNTRGLYVSVAPIPIDWAGTDPSAVGDLAFTYQQIFKSFTAPMTDGSTFALTYDGREGTWYTLTSVSITDTPEPATLWLVGVGVAIGRRLRYQHVNV